MSVITKMEIMRHLLFVWFIFFQILFLAVSFHVFFWALVEIKQNKTEFLCHVLLLQLDICHE